MSALVLILEFLLALILTVAASQKLLAFRAWRAARAELGPDVPEFLWWGLPYLEIGAAVALGIGWRPWGGVGAAALFVAFSIVLTLAYRRGVRSECNCFGAGLPARVGPVAIVRAVALTALAVLTAVLSNPAEGIHVLAASVPLAAAAIVSLSSSVRPLLRQYSHPEGR